MTNRLFKNFMSRSVCEDDYTIYAKYKDCNESWETSPNKIKYTLHVEIKT